MIERCRSLWFCHAILAASWSGKWSLSCSGICGRFFTLKNVKSTGSLNMSNKQITHLCKHHLAHIILLWDLVVWCHVSVYQVWPPLPKVLWWLLLLLVLTICLPHSIPREVHPAEMSETLVSLAAGSQQRLGCTFQQCSVHQSTFQVRVYSQEIQIQKTVCIWKMSPWWSH